MVCNIGRVRQLAKPSQSRTGRRAKGKSARKAGPMMERPCGGLTLSVLTVRHQCGQYGDGMNTRRPNRISAIHRHCHPARGVRHGRRDAQSRQRPQVVDHRRHRHALEQRFPDFPVAHGGAERHFPGQVVAADGIGHQFRSPCVLRRVLVGAHDVVAVVVLRRRRRWISRPNRSMLCQPSLVRKFSGLSSTPC